MKIRTNLKPSELKRVGAGLQRLADTQVKDEIQLENPAEKELIRQVESVFDVMANSLQSEVARILLDKEN
jgi:hypothetical protein